MVDSLPAALYEFSSWNAPDAFRHIISWRRMRSVQLYTLQYFSTSVC